jgi:hypothetical protein
MKTKIAALAATVLYFIIVGNYVLLTSHSLVHTVQTIV